VAVTGDEYPRAIAGRRRRAPGYLLGLGIGLAAAAIIVVLGS
jgi:hypothetical protein